MKEKNKKKENQVKRIPWNGKRRKKQGNLTWCQTPPGQPLSESLACCSNQRPSLYSSGGGAPYSKMAIACRLSLSTHSRASLQGCFHPTWRLCVYDAVVEFFLFFYFLLLPWTKSAESSSPAAAAKDPIDGQGCESWGRPNPKKELEQQQPRRSWNNKQTRYSSLCFFF